MFELLVIVCLWCFLLYAFSGGKRRILRIWKQHHQEGFKIKLPSNLKKAVQDPAKQAQNEITDVIEKAIQPVSDGINQVPGLITQTEDRITKQMQTIPEEIQSSGDKLLAQIESIPPSLKTMQTTLSHDLEQIPQRIQQTEQQLTDQMSKLTRVVEQTVDQAEQRITREMNHAVEETTHGLKLALTKFEGFLQFFSDVFETIEGYLLCGVTRIAHIPQCWYYYALEMMGKLYYLPISLLVWFFSLQSLEEQVWNALEKLDAQVYAITSGQKTEELSAAVRSLFGETVALSLFSSSTDDDPRCPIDPFAPDANYGEAAPSTTPTKQTGFHLIHFPDSVVDQCYRCNLPSFPRPGRYF